LSCQSYTRFRGPEINPADTQHSSVRACCIDHMNLRRE
jgi:hypothetical protein